MLQAHSPLWYGLWVGPNVLLLVLAALLWQRRDHKLYASFLTLAIVGALGQLILCAADVVPWINPRTWWYLFWGDLLVEGFLKVAVIAAIFDNALRAYPSIGNLGKVLIQGLGAFLILAAAVLAALAPHDSDYRIVSGAHLLEQSIYLVETGVLVFIFLFAGYFRLRLTRPYFGISVGLAISACVHLAYWALMSNGGLPDATRYRLDFMIMGAHLFAVLLWSYYLLVPHKVPVEIVAVPQNDLAKWNRELERWLQQ